MTRAKHRFISAFVMFALITLSLPLAGRGVPAVAFQGASERTIEGVWRTAVAPRDCQTDVIGPFGIRGVFTFHQGGTMAEYGIGPGSSPALRSPGHGIWRREHGWQEYSFAFGYYRYDANGAFAGSQRVRATLQLAPNGDEFAGRSVVEIFDASDNLVGTFCAASMGWRFQ